MRNASSPLSRAPKVKFGGVLQVEHTKISVPFRAFIPDRCISIIRAPLAGYTTRLIPIASYAMKASHALDGREPGPLAKEIEDPLFLH
jgi:hypothetical protein